MTGIKRLFRRSRRLYVVFALAPDGCPEVLTGREYEDLSPLIEAARATGLRYWVTQVEA